MRIDIAMEIISLIISHFICRYFVKKKRLKKYFAYAYLPICFGFGIIGIFAFGFPCTCSGFCLGIFVTLIFMIMLKKNNVIAELTTQ